MNATGAGVSSPRLDSEGGAVQCLQCGHRGAEGYAFGGVPEAGTLCDSPAVEVAEKDVRDFGSVEIGFRAEEVIQDFELRRAQAWFVGLGDLLAWVGWEGAEFAIGLVDDASTIGRERMDLGLTEKIAIVRSRWPGNITVAASATSPVSTSLSRTLAGPKMRMRSACVVLDWIGPARWPGTMSQSFCRVGVWASDGMEAAMTITASEMRKRQRIGAGGGWNPTPKITPWQASLCRTNPPNSQNPLGVNGTTQTMGDQ